MNKTAHTLNDLIEIARDGKNFYDEAADKVRDAELSALFTRIAGTKADIIATLSAAVSAAGGKPAGHGTLVGSMQQLYGRLRASFGDTTYGFVSELEASEDRLLHAFREVLDHGDIPPSARQEIQRLLPEVQQTHAVMRERKHALKRAS